MPIEIDVELARCTLAVQELELGAGSVIPMKKPAGGRVDVMAGAVHLGSGDIVDVTHNTLSVRITTSEQPGDGTTKDDAGGTVGNTPANLGDADLLADVCVPVRISLGAARIPFRNVVELNLGSLVNLGDTRGRIGYRNRRESGICPRQGVGNRRNLRGRDQELAPFSANSETATGMRARDGAVPPDSSRDVAPGEDGEEQSHPGPAETFDFRRGETLSNLELGSIRLMHEMFVRSLAPELTTRLCSRVAGKVQEVAQRTYAEFLEGVRSRRDVSPCSIYFRITRPRSSRSANLFCCVPGAASGRQCGARR